MAKYLKFTQSWTAVLLMWKYNTKICCKHQKFMICSIENAAKIAGIVKIVY